MQCALRNEERNKPSSERSYALPPPIEKHVIQPIRQTRETVYQSTNTVLVCQLLPKVLPSNRHAPPSSFSKIYSKELFSSIYTHSKLCARLEPSTFLRLPTMEHLREWKHNLKEFVQRHRWRGVDGCSSSELCDFCIALLKKLASSSAFLQSYPQAKLIGLEHAQCSLCRLVFKAAKAIADHTGEEAIQVYVDRGQQGSRGKSTLAVGPQGSGSSHRMPPFFNIYRRTSHGRLYL